MNAEKIKHLRSIVPMWREVCSLIEATSPFTSKTLKECADQIDEPLSALLDEVEALTADAERWRHFACAQTALMLGTKRNPNDPLVDWLIECNELADAARHEPKDAE
jgi:hypothetical protein